MRCRLDRLLLRTAFHTVTHLDAVDWLLILLQCFGFDWKTVSLFDSSCCCRRRCCRRNDNDCNNGKVVVRMMIFVRRGWNRVTKTERRRKKIEPKENLWLVSRSTYVSKYDTQAYLKRSTRCRASTLKKIRCFDIKHQKQQKNNDKTINDDHDRLVKRDSNRITPYNITI